MIPISLANSCCDSILKDCRSQPNVSAFNTGAGARRPPRRALPHGCADTATRQKCKRHNRSAHTSKQFVLTRAHLYSYTGIFE
jgi:hypothetical protein